MPEILDQWQEPAEKSEKRGKMKKSSIGENQYDLGRIEQLPRLLSDQVDDHWARLPAIELDPTWMQTNRIVTFGRSDPSYIVFDMIRTKLMKTLRDNGWRTVMITSPGPACGKTMVGLNLAFSLAKQKESRTVLMDLDLRVPRVGRTLGLQNATGMIDFISGRKDVAGTFVRHRGNLAIGASNDAASSPAELLQSTLATQMMGELRRQLEPDVVLIDMPPMLVCDDVMAFLPNVDGVLLVVASEQSTLKEIDRCERELAANTNVLGVVVNKCEFETDSYGYY